MDQGTTIDVCRFPVKLGCRWIWIDLRRLARDRLIDLDDLIASAARLALARASSAA